MPLVDCHAHYTDARFADPTFPRGREGLLEDIFAAGEISAILDAGTDLPSSRASVALAARYERMYAAVGIHPEDCGSVTPQALPAALDELRQLARGEKVVAIGEIGLDYYRESNPPREWQKIVFEAQLDLAEELSLPVVVHDREAHGDTLALLSRHAGVRGLLHSFSGSREMARELLPLGWYFSFSGTLTFKNAVKPGETLHALPLERILTETDCPYLTPVPHRGQINHSGYLHYTAEKEAQLLGIPYEDFCAATIANARSLFGIPVDT